MVDYVEGVTPVRTRIMQTLQARFLARTEGVDGARMTWNQVVRHRLSNLTQKLGSCMAITSGNERVIKRDMTETRVLPVTFEFEARAFLGEEPEDAIVEVLCEIQATIKADLQLGGLCLHIYETDNTLDVDAGQDRSIGGFVTFDVTYRHLFDDPRRKVGG